LKNMEPAINKLQRLGLRKSTGLPELIKHIGLSLVLLSKVEGR
jgi:hypothetical protein